MNEIICPNCKKVFKVDEAGFADILKQVRDHQFEEELLNRLNLANKEKEKMVTEYRNNQKFILFGSFHLVLYVCLIAQTNIPDFRNSEMEVYRRFSDFLGLHEKLVVKYLQQGFIIPPPPEKSVIGNDALRFPFSVYGKLDVFKTSGIYLIFL